MAWSDEELVELQASAISKRVGRAQAEEDFRLRLIPLLRRHPALFFPPNAREANAQASDEALVELAHRMASLIQIAAFDIESDENILHNCNDQTEMDSDDESSSLLVEDNDNAVENIVTPKGMVPLADMLNADAQRNNVSHFLR